MHPHLSPTPLCYLDRTICYVNDYELALFFQLIYESSVHPPDMALATPLAEKK